MRRSSGKLFERTPAGFHRRPVNVNPVDLLHLYFPDADSNRRFSDRSGQRLAPRRAQQLRVGHAVDNRVGSNYRSRDYQRASQRTHTDFIDAGHRRQAATPEFLLKAEVRLSADAAGEELIS